MATRKTIPVKFKKLDPEAVIPSKAYKGDNGMDVVPIDVEYDAVHDCYIYHTGLACEFPEGVSCKGMMKSRNYKTEAILTNGVGLIDPTYRGEIQFRYKNRKSLNDTEMDETIIMYLLAPWYRKITRKQREALMAECNHKSHYDPLDLAPYKVGESMGQLVFEITPDVDVTEVNELSETERGKGGFGSTGN